MEISEYKVFEIRKFQPFAPFGKSSYRIYLNDEFKETSSSNKNAKNRIDFCLENELWDV